MATGGGWLHRAELAPQAERRDHPAVHGKLRESELRPAGHGRLAPDQLLHHPRSEAPVAGFGLDDQIPVPAVPGRMRGQAAEAGAEHHRGDGRDGTEQRRTDRDGPYAGSRLERVAGAHDGGGRKPGGGRRPGHGRGAHAGPAVARPDRPDRQHGEQAEQGQAQYRRAAAEDEPVRRDPAVRVEPAHRPHRGQRRHRDRARHRQRHAAEDRDHPGQGRGQRGLAAGGAQHAEYRDVRGRPADHLRQALYHQH